jgi:hypothetical protein
MFIRVGGNSFISHYKSQKIIIKLIQVHKTLLGFPKKITQEGFEPGSSVLKAEAMTTAPGHQGHVCKMFCPPNIDKISCQ